MDRDAYRLNGPKGPDMSVGGGPAPRLSPAGQDELDKAAKAYNKRGPGRSKVEVLRKVRGPADRVKGPWD